VGRDLSVCGIVVPLWKAATSRRTPKISADGRRGEAPPRPERSSAAPLQAPMGVTGVGVHGCASPRENHLARLKPLGGSAPQTPLQDSEARGQNAEHSIQQTKAYPHFAREYTTRKPILK